MNNLRNITAALGSTAAAASWRQWTILIMATAFVSLGTYDVLAAWNGAPDDTFSEIFRSMNRSRWFYGGVFALYLILGWHLFWTVDAWR